MTICTFQRQSIFGKIDQGAMRMNEAGWIVWEEWERSSTMRPGLELIGHVVMPNHFHGLAMLPPIKDMIQSNVTSTGRGKQFVQKPSSLGSFVAGFKASCTRQIRHIQEDSELVVWQRGYWEHIVRNEVACGRINEYIETNPLMWSSDRENPQRTSVDEFSGWLEGSDRK